MEKFMEIINTILPALITGVFTFIVTKYNYNKNVPLDKMEISYNRIYYPIYKIIHKKDIMKNLDITIEQIKPYLDKYNKYADISTLKAFNSLCENKDKYSYNNFTNNIYNRNTYLRRRLGYLESNIFQIYTYSNKNEKFVIRLLLELIILYCFTIIYACTKDTIKNVSFYIAAIIMIIVLIDLLMYLLYIIGIKIKEFYRLIKSKLKKMTR